MAYKSDDLTVTAFLCSRGFPPDRAETMGHLVVFHFDRLTPGQAEEVLRLPNFQVCKSYHMAWLAELPPDD
jgi:hypothetical protein